MERSALHEDDMRYDAIIRNLIVIGEAAKHVPEDARSAIWTVVHDHVPALGDSIRSYLTRS